MPHKKHPTPAPKIPYTLTLITTAIIIIFIGILIALARNTAHTHTTAPTDYLRSYAAVPHANTQCTHILTTLPPIPGYKPPIRNLEESTATYTAHNPIQDPFTLRCGIQIPSSYTPTAHETVVDTIRWYTESSPQDPNGRQGNVWISTHTRPTIAVWVPADSGTIIEQTLSHYLATHHAQTTQ